MLDVVVDEARAMGADVTVIDVSDLSVKPCTGCMVCRRTGRCNLPADGAQHLMSKIDDCDAVVIGAPTYWGNMPGQLKTVFDRIVYGMIGEGRDGRPVPMHKGKRAAFLSTCTTIYPFNLLFNQSRGTVRALKEIFRWSGFRVVSVIHRPGTRRHPAMTARDKNHCKSLVREVTGKRRI